MQIPVWSLASSLWCPMCHGKVSCGRLGCRLSPCRMRFYNFLIFQALVSWLMKATGEWLTPRRLTQGSFVNQKINLLIYSDSDTATICLEHAVCQTLSSRLSYSWSHLILLSVVNGCPQREAYLEKWKGFKEFLGYSKSRQREIEYLWK